jgi:hypothetical protein
VINLAIEQTFPLPQAARYLPRRRGGKPVHFSTLLRWVLQGVKAPGGGRVKLEALRVGNCWCTSAQAVQRFVEATTPGTTLAAPPRTPGKRSRADRAAAAKLESIGI